MLGAKNKRISLRGTSSINWNSRGKILLVVKAEWAGKGNRSMRKMPASGGAEHSVRCQGFPKENNEREGKLPDCRPPGRRNRIEAALRI